MDTFSISGDVQCMHARTCVYVCVCLSGCLHTLQLCSLYLLVQLQEAGQVAGVKVVHVVAVGEHEQVEVTACRHHLVEGTKLLKAQGALVVIGVCLLGRREECK